MHLLRNLLIAGVFAILAVPAASPNLYAQTELNFKRVIHIWPTVELYFTASCSGQPEFNLTKQNFRVVENGIEIPDFTLWSPDPNQRCAASVALVFDASTSMGGPGNAGAIAAGHAFVDLMDGVVDEAAVLWFNTTVTVQQGVTTNKTLLDNAIDNLPASGGTAVWDGIKAGLEEIVSDGSNTCKAVIAMTDGNDNSSIHTPDEIISIATRNHIRVFTIGLGSVSPAQLETIAVLTGGKYYQAPSPNQLTAIYEEIADIIYASFYECMITYQAVCADGAVRTVDLTLQNLCGGSDIKTRTYRVPKDTSTYTPIDLRIGDGTVRGGNEITLPLELLSPTTGNFYQHSFNVKFPSQYLQFKSFATPPGAILEGLPIDIVPISGGVRITVQDRVQRSGPGLLGEMTLIANDVPDTTLADVQLENWVFEAGCYKPVLHDGSVAIIPRAPIVNCTMQVPNQLTWVRSAKDYAPNPFIAKCRVFNSGDLKAENMVVKIDFDPTSFTLLSPISDVQPGVPADIDPGGMSEVQWSLMASRRLTGDSVSIDFTIYFDNHKSITCSKRIWIPPTEPILECSIDPVTIVSDQENQRYLPMPFDLNVDVLNRGGMKTDSVYATIVLPQGDLTLADGPNDGTKLIAPMFLLPNQSGNVQWRLAHPVTLEEKEYTVNVWVKTSNADSSLCQVKVTIPPLFAPVLQAQCTVPDTLVFDENVGGGGEYIPNPFNIRLSAVNLGAVTAEGVTGTVYLPDGCVLDPSSPIQTLRVSFDDLDKWQPGDPIPTKRWVISYHDRPDTPRDLTFKFAVSGISAVGQKALDTVFTLCNMHIPPVPPPFTCSLLAPDTLRVNAGGNDVLPNPFLLKYSVVNVSNYDATIEEITLNYPSGSGSLTPAPGNEQTRTVNQSVSPGDTAFFEWEYQVTKQLTAEDLHFEAEARYETSKRISCEATVHREALRTSLTCNISLDKQTIDYDSASQSYPDPTVTVTATIQNPSGWPQSDLVVELNVADPGGFLEFDPAYQNDNPWTRAVLFGGQATDAQWHFRLAKEVDSIPAQFVDFSVSYGSREVPTITEGCIATVQINPVIHIVPVKVYTGDVPLPDSTNNAVGIGQPRSTLYPREGSGGTKSAAYEYAIAANYPNPFASHTDITYSLADESEVTLTVHNLLGREVAQLVSDRQKAGQYTVRFDAKDLPGGVYLVRMHAGKTTRSRVMMLQR